MKSRRHRSLQTGGTSVRTRTPQVVQMPRRGDGPNVACKAVSGRQPRKTRTDAWSRVPRGRPLHILPWPREPCDGRVSAFPRTGGCSPVQVLLEEAHRISCSFWRTVPPGDLIRAACRVGRSADRRTHRVDHFALRLPLPGSNRRRSAVRFPPCGERPDLDANGTCGLRP